MKSHIGPYRINRLIDRGGQGSVYLGYDERLQRQVAIKIHSMPRERQGRRALLREARLVAAMDSPRIVQIYDVIESSAHLAMVMEYVPGCSLEDVLQARSLTLAAAMTVGTDVAAALAVARREQVVHGDLKAANVLLTRDGRARLTDFGISRSVALPQSGQVSAGSLSALSPEQCSGLPIDGQADLFALGTLLYRMLSGEHPFMQEGQLDVERLREARYLSLIERLGAGSDLPPPLFDLVQQLLQRDPAKRPAHTRGARQIMRSVVRDLPIAAQYTLAQESAPFFRRESAEDFPVSIPQDIAREGRSRLPPKNGGLAMLGYWLRGWNWPQRLAAAALSLALLLVPVVAAYSLRSTTVSFAQPVYSLDAAPPLSAMSSDWLIEQLKYALEDTIGPLEVRGDLGVEPSITLNTQAGSPPGGEDVKHRIHTTVRCAANFCIFDLKRISNGDSRAAQGVFFPEQPPQEWARRLRQTVAQLFP